ncbi:MAG TPA: PQQ-dependent sugar dehydrogenase [Xanthomonadales bacterium]|nr:PQQ-dependent sugar dehydrogenase [Xanthomonadales bacterium]
MSRFAPALYIPGLGSQFLIVVDLKGDMATESERQVFGSRLREVEQGPDGAVWVLEDGDGGRLLKLTAFND